MHKKLLLAAFGALIFAASFGAAGYISESLTLKFALQSWASVLLYLSIPVGMYFIVAKKSPFMSYGYNFSAILVMGITVLILATAYKDGNFSPENKAAIMAKIESYKKNGS